MQLPTATILNGTALENALEGCARNPPMLVEHLLAETAIFMLCSDGGVGKSTATVCALASMSSGLLVWGAYKCARPLRVVFLVGERNINEPLRRLKALRSVAPLDPANFWITDIFAGTIDLLTPEHVEMLIQTIARDCPLGPDVIVIDPLFAFCNGGLSDDRTAVQATRALIRIKMAFNCVLWINHHVVKPRLLQDGQSARPTNPFYGAVHLNNVVTTQYWMERDGEHRTVLRLLKDSWGVQQKTIPLDFDGVTSAVTLPDEHAPTRKGERVELFLQGHVLSGLPFSREDVIRETGISQSQLYSILSAEPWASRIVKSKSPSQTVLYHIPR